MTVRIATTTGAVFSASGDWQDAPTHVRAWIGTNFIGEDDLPATAEVLENNDTYTIPSGTQYDWTMTPDGAVAGRADAALAALMNAGADEVSLRFSLHTAALAANANGDALAANELATGRNPGYARASAAFGVTAV